MAPPCPWVLVFAKLKKPQALEPFNFQLRMAHRQREIVEYEAALSLSEDIAVKALKTGMLSRLSKTQIRKKIRNFLSPENVKSHGRAILPEDAKRSGLKVRVLNSDDKVWSDVYELYMAQSQS